MTRPAHPLTPLATSLEPGSSAEYEALIAGSVALMTTWARRRHEALPACAPMVAKLLANLTLLAHHPLASPALQRVMSNAHAHWLAMAPAPAVMTCHGQALSGAVH